MTNSASAIMLALVMAGLAGGAIAVHQTRLPGRAVLEYWRPDDAQHRELRHLVRERITQLPSKTEYGELLDRYVRMQWESVTLDRQEFRQRLAQQSEELHELAVIFIKQHGWDAYLAVGTMLSERVYRALIELSRDLVEQGKPLQDWLAEHSDNKQLRVLRSLGGRFLERAVTAGLVTHSQPLDGDRMLVARQIWLEHWVTIGGSRDGKPLSDLERGMVLRWKVEDAQHLDLGRRLQLIDAVEQVDPHYPGLFVAAILHLREGNQEQAIEYLQECVTHNEEAVLAADWLVAIRPMGQGL